MLHGRQINTPTRQRFDGCDVILYNLWGDAALKIIKGQQRTYSLAVFYLCTPFEKNHIRPKNTILLFAQPYSFPMQQFLEILKYTIPGLVVFATAYYMLQLYLEGQIRQQSMSQRNESLKITLPLRLQAYERLMLLCDRTEIQNVLLRIQNPSMSVRELRGSLLLAIIQEFEHNTSQKLYV